MISIYFFASIVNNITENRANRIEMNKADRNNNNNNIYII